MYRLVTRDGQTLRQDPSERSALQAGKRLASERGEPLRLVGVYHPPTTDRPIIEPDGTRRAPSPVELFEEWGVPRDDYAEEGRS